MIRTLLAVALLSTMFLESPLALGGDERATLYEQKLTALLELSREEQFAVDPSDEIVFPQLANGVSGNLGITTSIVLSNADKDELDATLKFRTSGGEPMSVELYNSATREVVGSGTTIVVPIPGFESVFLETRGEGDLAVGWARVSAPSGKLMGGVAAYQILDSGTGTIQSIVGVGASSATPAFLVPVRRDVSLDTNTAIALANNSDVTVRLRYFLFDNEGLTNATGTISLEPRSQLPRFVNEIVPSVGERFYGTMHFLRVDSDGEVTPGYDVHAMALILSHGFYSSIPVTSSILR